jgi:hypothetical protein
MMTTPSLTTPHAPLRLVLGFAAAFLSTLVFHQIGLAMLHALGVTPAIPWSLKPVPPFGVPAVISLAFWGGVWGVVLVLCEPWLARAPGGYWLGVIVFGAVFPTLAAWFIVFPLKGLPAAGGFHLPGITVGPIVNGLWGLGTGVFLSLLAGGRQHQPA